MIQCTTYYPVIRIHSRRDRIRQISEAGLLPLALTKKQDYYGFLVKRTAYYVVKQHLGKYLQC